MGAGNSPGTGLTLPTGTNSPGTGLNLPTGTNSPSRSTGPTTTGLVLWLKSDTGVVKSGSNVTSWADQSGNGNDVTGVASPQFTASSINGLPGITIAANLFGTQTLSGANSLMAADTARTAIAVIRKNADGGSVWNGVIGFGRAATSLGLVMYAGSTATANVYAGSSNPYTAGFVPSTSTNYILQWDVPSLTSGDPLFYVNGAPQTLTGPGPLGSESGITAGFYIGSTRSDGLGTGLYADICEVLVYSHALSVGETAQNKAYLSARYAITVS